MFGGYNLIFSCGLLFLLRVRSAAKHFPDKHIQTCDHKKNRYLSVLQLLKLINNQQDIEIFVLVDQTARRELRLFVVGPPPKTFSVHKLLAEHFFIRWSELHGPVNTWKWMNYAALTLLQLFR